jgi:hypothetical protein
MLARLLLALALVCQAAPGQALAQSRPAAPTESVWKPADTPPGGVSWSLLESTKEITRKDAKGYIVSKPDYPPGVLALNGKTIKVSGYLMPLQNGKLQTHFVLLAYPPDCPFHLNPGPAQFIEVKTAKGVAFDYSVKTIEGVLQLDSQSESGVFFKLQNGRAL